jgi:hypothetical protein
MNIRFMFAYIRFEPNMRRSLIVPLLHIIYVVSPKYI